MATYYVSATTGDDSNDGSSVANSFATIGAGENAATTAGDIVYIAPGIYREQVLHGYSGTSADRIYFIGDPDCEIFGNAVTPGIVRITQAEAVTEYADDTNGGYVIKSNNKDFITWKNVYVDGISGAINAYNDNNNGYGFYANSEADYMECINCMAQSIGRGFMNISRTVDCVSMCYIYDFYGGYHHDRAVATGANYGFYGANNVTNSITMAYIGFRNCDVMYNCMVFGGGTYGLYLASGDYAYDNLIVGYRYGTYGQGGLNARFSGSYYTGTSYPVRQGAHHGLGFGSVTQAWQATSTDPHLYEGITDGSKLIEQKGLILWSINDLNKLRKVLRPNVLNDAIRGVTDADRDSEVPKFDILGHPRKMGTASGSAFSPGVTPSQRDLGPWELSSVEITGSAPSSSSPVFKIADEGMFSFPLVVSGSTTVTASIGVKHQSGTGTAVQPQLILKYSETNVTASITSNLIGNHQTASALYIQTTTSTLADNTWGTLSVSGSFQNMKSKELELVVYQQQTGSDAISSFSDVEIQ